MSTFLKSVTIAFMMSGAFADPVKALLVVQNHAATDFACPLEHVQSHLSAALAGDVFEIIDANDAIGENLNRAAEGERMPQSSATRLAENLGAGALITASISDVSVEKIGNPERMRKLHMTLTLQAKRIPSGASVSGIELSAESPASQPTQFENNAETIYEKLVSRLCCDAAKQFLDKTASVTWVSDADRIMVAFGCNFPGADIAIDGVSYGTAGTFGGAPLQVQISPGLHTLVVSYPFALPYKVQANFTPNSTYLITLEETDEGRRRHREDQYFAELLDRAQKSGATDDFVRTEKAKGYAKYLSSSHTRIEGMPKTLVKWNWETEEKALVDTGLDGAADSAEPMKTTADVLDDAENLTK